MIIFDKSNIIIKIVYIIIYYHYKNNIYIYFKIRLYIYIIKMITVFFFSFVSFRSLINTFN